MRAKRSSQMGERYEIDQSPFAQKPTQNDIALLLHETKSDLIRLVKFKDQFIVRRQITKNGKTRDLAYPVDRLRVVHEILKFHLNKIRQPDYLMSPRKNRQQRQNAELHLDQEQYLTLDFKKFYPSTSDKMIFNFFCNRLSMYPDVARLLTELCTVDGIVSFGSPVTPVLCSLVHRPMFDEIASICNARGLRYSIWVDDLTISGRFIPGSVLVEIRKIAQKYGLKTHKIEFKCGNRPVFITGIGVVGSNLIAPNTMDLKIKHAWEAYHSASTLNEKDDATQRLLSLLGTVRYISGANSSRAQKSSNQINALKQKQEKLHRLEYKRMSEAWEKQKKTTPPSASEMGDMPF